MTVRRCAAPDCPHLIRWAVRCPQHRTKDSGVNVTARGASAAGVAADSKAASANHGRFDLPAPDSGDPGSHGPAGVAAPTSRTTPSTKGSTP